MAEPVRALGTRGVVRTERGMDVTLRYAFPAEGLKPEPLSTLLMLVVSTASQPRKELPAGTGRCLTAVEPLSPVTQAADVPATIAGLGDGEEVGAE